MPESLLSYYTIRSPLLSPKLVVRWDMHLRRQARHARRVVKMLIGEILRQGVIPPATAPKRIRARQAARHSSTRRGRHRRIDHKARNRKGKPYLPNMILIV